LPSIDKRQVYIGAGNVAPQATIASCDPEHIINGFATLHGSDMAHLQRLIRAGLGSRDLLDGVNLGRGFARAVTH
jgi:hypothetical protein